MEQRTLSTWCILRRVAGYLKAHRARFAGGIGLVLLAIALEVIKPWPIAIVLDVLDNKQPRPMLLPFVGNLPVSTLIAISSLSFALIPFVLDILNLGSNYLNLDVGQRMVNDLRTAIYSHLQKLSLRFHYKQETGDLLFRVMSDTFAIQSMVMNGMMPLLSSTITLVMMFWIMVTMDCSLALVALGVCP